MEIGPKITVIAVAGKEAIESYSKKPPAFKSLSKKSRGRS